MKKYLYALLTLIVFVGCKKEEKFVSRTISSIEIEMIYEDSLFNVRALTVNNENEFYFSGTKSSLGFSNFNGFDSVRQFQLFNYDSLVKPNLEFRAISETSNNIFFISVANPSLLYKIRKTISLSDHLAFGQHQAMIYERTLFQLCQ